MIAKTAAIALIAYTAGLHWIFTSLHDFGELPAWLAAIATLLLAAYVSLYAVAAAAIIRGLRPSGSSWTTPFLIATVITLLEWTRGWMLTGFPWLALGYLAIDTPLAGYAPILGVYGVGFMLVLCLIWVAQILRYRKIVAFVLLTTSLIAGWVSLTHDWTTPHDRPLRVALAQGNIAQSMKFDPDREVDAIHTHLTLARVAAVPGGAQLIVLPETALTRPWEIVPLEVREAFLRVTQSSGATLMLGAPVRHENGYRNSLVSLTPDTTPGLYHARYDKQHLVPFGEFIPWGFRWFVDMMKMPLGDFQRGDKVQQPFAVSNQRIGANICFEDLFGEEIIRALSPNIAADQHPTILLNVSNLAWFGDSIALSQHLAISRMRAIETGRPMLRATNTGATAIIDHRGVVQDQLDVAQEGLLTGQVQGMQGVTPYARLGNLAILLICLISLGVALALGRSERLRRARG
jgi:apolipoprotein N-acyltransferase